MASKSVDVLVAEAVERAAEARTLPPTHVRAVALALGFPALVEALSRAYDVLCGEDDAAEAATEASVILLDALGGVRVSGRAEPDDQLAIARMERDWARDAWASAVGISPDQAEAELLAWTAKWRESAIGAAVDTTTTKEGSDGA